MKRKILLIFLIFVVLLIAIGSVVFTLKTKENKVCFENNCYTIEIARTQEEKEKGLMYRENLGKDRGMLFINREEVIYPFWMKSMQFPLDIIWLDNNSEIVFIAKNAQPCAGECNNIIPDKPARYILELNAGEVERIGLQVGDKIN